MNILAILLAVLVFPLNFIMALPVQFASGGFFGVKNIENQNQQEGVVAGESTQKNENEYFHSNITIPEYVPIKKEGVADLKVPNAHSSLVLDAESGTILHYSNGKERRQIASLTKMMTAVLVMEKISDLEKEIVTVDDEAVYVEGTKVGCPRSGYCITQRLKVGEKISALNLLKAMLMNSANDSAIALGKHIAGSQEKFADMMNEKAKELGLEDTHFCTASGLEIEGRENECYSTAYDIGRIAAYSLKYPQIWEIFRLPNNLEISSADGKLTHYILNTDQVLDQIPNCLGGKTGFTPLAGRSLMMAATDKSGEHKVIAVLLDDPYRWQDIRTMLDWAFVSYDWK